ncbi:MAG: DUF72 domain-containing protein [Candidatus Rokuibacteriota bacterium]
MPKRPASPEPPPSPLIRYHPDGPVTTEYRVGLCAWQDTSMVEEGSFYPIKSMKAEERLWWYSRFFDCVEVNSTFYAPLSPRNAVLWAKRTPPGFLFSVKAYALLTGHHLDAGRLPPPLAAMRPASARPNPRGQLENQTFGEDAREWAFAAFREALQPLADAGKLGYVLFQMAPWVKYGERALAYLASLPTRLPGATIAVEFRDASWLPRHAEETLELLTRRGMVYVSVDAPRTPASVDTTVGLTAPTAVIRLHGRNREGFMRQLQGRAPSVAEKYGYLYDREQLARIVARGGALEGQARRVYFKLNNNVGDAPAINGLDIKELLGLETADRAAVEREWRSRRRVRPSAPEGPESA